MNHQPAKGTGQPAPDKTRWVMRNNDGSEWETNFHYTRAEVEAWELSKPVRPITH